MKKKIGWLVAGSAGVICISFLLDLFNVPSSLGLNMEAVNWDAMALIVGNALVILIACITYLLIDQRNCRKEINQRSNAIYLLRSIYTGLQHAIKTTQEQTFSCMLLQMDFDHRTSIQKSFLSLSTFMQESIRNFSESGVLSPKEYETYFRICAEYMYNINLCFMMTPEFKLLSPETVIRSNKKLLKLIHSAVEELDKSES